MNYYERHLGDYARDTAHLSLLEHGVYTLLLDRYYATEQPIPADQAHRIARARSRDEKAAVDAVLAEFFTLIDGAYRNRRADGEVSRMQAKIEAQRANGKRGGRPRKSDYLETKGETQGKPTGFDRVNPAETQPKALQTPDSSIYLPTEDCRQAKPADPCPHEAIIALWAEVLPELRQPRTWIGARRDHLRARWRESRERQSLEWWRELFGYVRQSDFLMGRVQSRDRRPFDCGLDWLVMPANFAKVIDGNYHATEAA